MKEVTLYEVYSRVALHRPIDGLLRLHWSTAFHYARLHSKDWGGCVVKLRARVHCWKPLQRDVVGVPSVVYVAPTTAVAWDPGLNVGELRGKLMRGFGGRIPRYKTRKR